MGDYQKYFGETHELIRNTVRKFVEKEIKPYVDEWEEQGEFPIELFKKAADVGLHGIGYPVEYGGTGGDIFQTIAAAEELVRCGSGGLIASLGSLGIAIPPIVNFGPEEMKRKVIPEVLKGEKIAALAITEPGAGSDVANISTKAVREGDHYIVNGSKTFITSGVRADYYTVAVRTGEKGFGGISLILIEKGTPGFSVGRKLKKMGWWASDTAELFFDGCKVPVANLLGEENKGFLIIMSNFQAERLSLAVIACMTAQLAFEESMNYVQEREAFGKQLARFQVIRHKLAIMATQIDICREYIYRLAAKMDAGESIIKEVSMAKNFSTQVSDMATYEAVQIFGGMGFMRESLVERLYRDNRILSIGGGTYEIMNEIICKQIGL